MTLVGKRLLKPFALWVTACFFASGVSVNAEYVVRGPEGNTIVVDDESISGEFEGADYSITEDEATIDGHSTSDDGGGGGGGSGTAIAVAAGLVIVAVAAGFGLWWYFNRYKVRQALYENDDSNRIVVRQLSEDAEIALMPKLIELATESETANLPEQRPEDLTAFDVALRVRF